MSFRLYTLAAIYTARGYSLFSSPPFFLFRPSLSGVQDRSQRNIPVVKVKDSKDSERPRNSQEPQRCRATSPALGLATENLWEGGEGKEGQLSVDPQHEVFRPMLLSLIAAPPALSQIIFTSLGGIPWYRNTCGKRLQTTGVCGRLLGEGLQLERFPKDSHLDAHLTPF